MRHISLSSLVLVSTLLLGPASLASAQDTPWKPFAEVIRGSEAGRGIFTVYYKRERVYLSLTRAQFDRDYLLVSQLAQGIASSASTAAPPCAPTSCGSTARATGSSSGP